MELPLRKKKKKEIDITSNDDNTQLYSYAEMLARCRPILLPENIVQEKLTIPPPNVSKLNKSTHIANFSCIAFAMNRESSHLMKYFIDELQTHGSINSVGGLIIKAKLNIGQIQQMLRRYSKKYVICHLCKSFNTQLIHENRLEFINCKKCYAKVSTSEFRMI